MVLNSGINKNNYEKVVQLVKKIIFNVQNGKVSKKDILKCKKEYINELRDALESNNGLIEYVYGREIFKTDDIKDRIEKIKNITSDDVVNMTRKINLDTIFFLEGEL